MLPTLSIARTAKTCGPEESVRLAGLVQASQPASSQLHWKLLFASLELNAYDTVGFDTVPVGPAVIEVSGGVVSGAARWE
ncbi:MAG: hypothetical protein V9G04_12715 [Nocardioides sp.]